MDKLNLEKIIGSICRYLRPALITIICIYGLYLRVVTLAVRQLSPDEMFQVHVLNSSFLQFLQSLRELEYCSYLSGDYFLLYPFFKIFGYNKWGLAIPHIISTILGFWLLYLICRKYLRTTFAYLIVFVVVCLNINLIGHALELRVYAVLPTLALGCLYLCQRLVGSKTTFKQKIAVGLFFVITIWFHVYGLLILFVTALFSLFEKRRDPSFGLIFKDFFKFMSVVLAMSLPLWIISVFGPHAANQKVDIFEYIPNPLFDIIGFLKGVFANLIGYRHKQLYLLLIGLFFPLLIPYKRRFEQMTFLIFLVFVPIGIILLADVKNSYWFVQRQFVWVIPFFALFLGWSWDSLFCYIGKKFLFLDKIQLRNKKGCL